MKKKFMYLVMSLSLIIGIASPAVVYARNGADDSNTVATTATQSSTATTTGTKTEAETETADDSTGRDTRISEYKKKLTDALTTEAKTRIAGRCVAAQAILKVKKSDNSKASVARTTAYNAIVTNLEKLSTSLAAKGKDVTTLNANIAVLKTKIAAFTAVNTTYQAALADASALGCTTDPTAFKAALEMARTEQKSVLAAAKDIRTYLNDTVKVTLKAIKTEAEGSSADTTNN